MKTKVNLEFQYIYICLYVYIYIYIIYVWVCLFVCLYISIYTSMYDFQSRLQINCNPFLEASDQTELDNQLKSNSRNGKPRNLQQEEFTD